MTRRWCYRRYSTHSVQLLGAPQRLARIGSALQTPEAEIGCPSLPMSPLLPTFTLAAQLHCGVRLLFADARRSDRSPETPSP
jgi:hypothetical protein